jgi:hypothetical protein
LYVAKEIQGNEDESRNRKEEQSPRARSEAKTRNSWDDTANKITGVPKKKGQRYERCGLK